MGSIRRRYEMSAYWGFCVGLGLGGAVEVVGVIAIGAVNRRLYSWKDFCLVSSLFSASNSSVIVRP